ncbi:MAG: SAM-dependent DNA methyltransferase [Prosthecobacter sp.]|jgi:type I restriction enzyme M protein|uniref:type I restriction-modification system subunit M n=1 Tax=Prosthecobacter sp. TaxID=1965333 RepID=UPI001A006318|nr:N-6 DNA methylase [Prosthecobacter sp.]MBE2285898.1 SAM-dependent DNA methyltransferase [Prosthecobacter sp.]
MTPHALQDIAKLEDTLWEAADQLRANSKLTSSEYCFPILGIIFLRHATNRYNAVAARIEEEKAAGKLPKKLPITKAHFIARRALMLPPEARYETLIALPKGTNLGSALVEAMNAIERDFEPLANQLPKDYGKFDNDLLESMLRIFDSEALRRASGDVFGRIYEYFLMKFAIQGAQDNGEFFTPPSLVQMIVNVIEPDHGVVADLACGSGGMFVQTSHFMEDHGQHTMDRVTFYGQEKTATTIRLAKMNLAVHGLEGEIMEANTFYQDEHRLSDGRPLWGNCDFMMANPPFNVDMVDEAKVKGDRRLPFGLPGVNKSKTISNANYLWISYFHSYLNAKGRAGFVMSSQASSAGHGEAEVRQKLVATGDVDVMMSIRSNFFYTRSVPCELWFFDKGKPAERKDSVLMLDARNVYRKVTRKIFDFSAEQQKNLTAIVWLYRGERLRFAELVAEYRQECLAAAAQLHHAAHFCHPQGPAYETEFLIGCLNKFTAMLKGPDDCIKGKPTPADVAAYQALASLLPETWKELQAASEHLHHLLETHRSSMEDGSDPRRDLDAAIGRYTCNLSRMEAAAAQMDAFCQLAARFGKEVTQAADFAAKQFGAHRLDVWRKDWRVPERMETLQTALAAVSEATRTYAYFRKQVHWLLHRFPEGVYVDVPGLCKIASKADIEAADWSLTPGRYVGVAPAEVDEDFDFGQAMRDIHVELKDLDREASELAAKIQANFEGLGI